MSLSFLFRYFRKVSSEIQDVSRAFSKRHNMLCFRLSFCVCCNKRRVKNKSYKNRINVKGDLFCCHVWAIFMHTWERKRETGRYICQINDRERMDAWYPRLISIPCIFFEAGLPHFRNIVLAHARGETRGERVAENSNVGWRLRKFRIFGAATLRATSLVSRELAVVEDYASRRPRWTLR